MAIDFGGLFSGLTGAYGYDQLQNSINSSQQNTIGALNNITSEGRDLGQGTFKPYSVTSNFGNTTMNPDGSMNAQLSGLGQQQADRAGLYGLQAWQRATGDPTARQNEIYGAMQASMAPDNARQEAQMNEQLHRSGRLGMMTGAYGGTPEQLAYQKALQEQQSKNWLGAQGAAQAEQLQQFNMGQGFLASSQDPTKNLLNQGSLGMANKGVNNAMTTQLMDYLASMGIGTATANQNFEDINAKLGGQYYGALGQLAGAAGNAVGPALNSGVNSVVNWGKGLWDSIF